MSLMRQRAVKDSTRDEYRHARLDPATAHARIEAAFQPRGIPIWWCLSAITVIWMMAAAYFFLLPPIYHSKWSLILPAASNGSTVSLDNIGQTSSRPSHPFGSVSLSPKVIYKEIANSEQVRSVAAVSLGLTKREFGKARVKLIDETSLLMFKMSGASPEFAQAKARALMRAFNAQLDVLRRDELEKRSIFVRQNLKIYRANLDNVREKMLAFKISSGLLSIEQFKEASISAELLRRKLAEQRAEQQQLITQQETLTRRIGLEPSLAAVGVRLASDPSFAQLADAYGKNSAAVLESHLRYGDNHPTLGILKMRSNGVLAELRKLAKAAGLSSNSDLQQLALVVSKSNQGDLFQEIVENESKLAGNRKAVGTLESELSGLEVKVAKMGKDAARLEALQKDHLVAEAVFTSAAARLDIERTDLFASYPMVQVLAQPSKPLNRSQPRLIYALAAGFLGTFLILMAWGAVWVRSRFVRKR